MPSTYSTNLKLELQATGENASTWGTISNTNFGTALEQAIVGYGNAVLPSDANLTLTYTNSNAAQTARALVLNVTSAVSLSTTRELVVPTIQKQYIVQNNTTGSQSITVKTAAGLGVTIPNGRKAHLYVNGTDVLYMDDYVDINGGAIDGTPIGAGSPSTGKFTQVQLAGSTSGFVGLAAPASSGSQVYVLPATDGTTGQLLSTNGSGVLSWSATGSVTSVVGTGSVNGITLTGTVTSSGNLTLGGTLSGVDLTSQVTGTLPVANGGTGQTTYTNGQLLIGNTTGNTLTKATLTAGTGVSITNGAGSITIAATATGGAQDYIVQSYGIV